MAKAFLATAFLGGSELARKYGSKSDFKGSFKFIILNFNFEKRSGLIDCASMSRVLVISSGLSGSKGCGYPDF